MLPQKRKWIKSNSPKKATRKSSQDLPDFADSILDSLDSQIAVIDSKGEILYVNKPWNDFAEENSPPSKLQTQIHANYLDVLRRAKGEWSDEAIPALDGILHVLAGNTDLFSLEYPCHSPTENRWFRMVATPLKAPVKGVVIRHQNITARKLLEAERQENLKLIEKLNQEKKLRYKFVSMVPGGFCTYKRSLDGKYSIPFASRGWESLFEISASDVAADATLALQRIHPEDIDKVHSAFGQAMESSSNLRIEYRINTPDKGTIWVEKFGTGLQGEDGSKLFSGFASDITERKKAEHALAEKLDLEKQISNIVYLSPGGFFSMLISQDLRSSKIIYASQKFFDLLGISKEELEKDQNQIYRMVHPEDVHRLSVSGREAIEMGTEWNMEFRIIDKTGKEKSLAIAGRPTANPEGSILLYAQLMDITERKKTERVLTQKLELENQISRMVNLAPGGFYSFISFPNKSARLLYASEKFKSLTQLNLGEAEKDFWATFKTINPIDIPKISYSVEKAFDSITGWHEEFRILRPDGKEIWVEGWAQPNQQHNGSIHWFGILVDITERKLEEEARKIAEERLVESEERYRALAENSEYPVGVVDAAGTILFANPSFAALFDRTPENILLKKYADFLTPEESNERMEIVARVLREKKPFLDEIEYFNKNGSLWYRRSFRPIAGWGKISQVLITGSDITEMKNESLRKEKYLIELESKVQERTKELREALNKEQELVEMKNKFISTTSHEFRTPLSTISLTAGFIRRYHERIDKPVLIEKLHLIEKQVRHMSLLLEDVLTIGRSEAGTLKINVTQFPLVPFIQSIVEEVEEIRKTHRIITQFHCRRDSISTDEKLIRNIIINLLTNAVKFSPNQDKVEFIISCDASSYYFTVHDFGVGIPEADQENIFVPFHRGVNVSDIQGTGLGLSIVKKAVDLLGGFISMRSKVGEGTSFEVTLPIHPSTPN